MAESMITGKLRRLFSRAEKRRLAGIVVLMTVLAGLEIAGLGLLMPLVALFTKPELLTQNRCLRFMSDWPVFADRKLLLLGICLMAVALWLFKTLLSLSVIRLQSRFVIRKQRE